MRHAYADCRIVVRGALMLALLAPASPSAITPAPSPPPAQQDIVIHLTRLQTDTSPISFGLPLAKDVLFDVSKVQIISVPTGAQISGVNAKALLMYWSPTAQPTSIRSILIQFPSAALTGATLDVRVVLNGAGGAGAATQPFSAVKFASPENARVADRSIVRAGQSYSWLETNVTNRPLYVGAEPKVLATFPDGYLAGTGILGAQMSRTELLSRPNLAGLRPLSESFDHFAKSAMYVDGYSMNPSGIYDASNYEAWLYDRCDTYLTAYTHFSDVQYLRFALRACSYYAGAIDADGIFTGKPDPDNKYSHLRGLFAYYALTGDEVAATAALNIANMWVTEPNFVQPYAQGRIRSAEALWTERLLATSIEDLTYGFDFTGDKRYWTAAEQLFGTAYRHITTQQQSELNAITNTSPAFPPQNCFIHSALQQSEGDADQPWCSIWMSELLVDPLMRYQEMTGDTRVDEVFLRLGRFLRDVGTQYFSSDLIPASSFIDPKGVIYDPANQGSDTRRVIPAYGSGVNASRVVQRYAEYDDFNHCADASGLAAAAIGASIRQKSWYTPFVVGPFHTEGESFTALFHELTSCADLAFAEFTRLKRDPRNWSSSELAPGYAGGDANAQKAWIDNNKIGFPSYPTDPQRKLSWWFNTSMLSLRMLQQTGIDFSRITAGFVESPGSGRKPTPLPPSTPSETPPRAPTNLHVL